LNTEQTTQKHFQQVLEMEAPEDLRGLARNGLVWRIAVRGLKARGPRIDAVFYPAGHCGCSGGSR
jgi:hypothetical protein